MSVDFPLMILATAAGLAGGAAAVLLSRYLFRPPRALRAESLDLVDGRGDLRARLTAGGAGEVPGLFLFDRSGAVLGDLSVAGGEIPRLSLNDRDGTSRATVLGGAAPALILHQKDGRRRCQVGLEPDGAPGIGLCDPGGKETAEFRFSGAGRPFLLLRDERGKVRAALGLLADGTPLVSVFDEEERVTWASPARVRKAG